VCFVACTYELTQKSIYSATPTIPWDTLYSGTPL
jgi:hypothetical protein